MAVQKIDGAKAAELVEAGALILDLREGADYAKGHIPGSVHVPLNMVSQATVAQYAPEKNAPVIVCCYVGGRSEGFAQILERLGYTEVYDLGSIVNWPGDLTV